MRNIIINPRKNVRSRTNPRHIIITPFHNMVSKNTLIKPHLLKSSYRYTWGSIEQYMYTQQKLITPLMHHYVEMIEDDYVFINGSGIEQRSVWLETLANNGVIFSQYRDAIVIALNEDFRIDIPDRRLLKGLANNLITSIMWEYKIKREQVMFIDEILTDNYKEKAMSEKNDLLQFILNESIYWDRNMFNMELKEYQKK